VSALLACSSKGNGFDGDGSTDDDGSADDGSIINTNDAGSNEGGCDLTCSSDLHDVIDCNGTKVMTCPPDQGCGPGGTCVPACDSAKANKSTIGCDYWIWPPEIIPEGKGACFAAFIANTWTENVTLTMDRAGQSLPVMGAARIPMGSGQSITYNNLPNGQLPQGQVAIVFLSRNGSLLTSCPNGVTPAYTALPASIDGTGIGNAIHLTTSRPVVAYDIFPYGGGQSAATSATLLIPTSAWDTNYVGVDAYRKSQIVPYATPSMAIVAQQDNTTVTISPTAAIVGGNGVAPTGKGVPKMYSLMKGQFLQLSQPEELTGSAIQANNPIALFGGASCLNIDVTDSACDSAHQQIPPVKALGHEYVAVRYRNRTMTDETPPWRIVGAVDKTTLSYSPTVPTGAPTTINNGQVVEFKSAGPFVVNSQDPLHPFYMSGHMTGGGTYGGIGDPEFVNVIPPQQWLASYVFFTDPTYPETNLIILRKKNKAMQFSDVTLDCKGTLTGWQPIGATDFQYTRTDLVTGNFAKVGNCDNGRHEIKSNDAFGLVVWGWGTGVAQPFSEYVSYAYPAGASVQPINTVVVPPTPK
jgi:hypothetical protein